MKNIIQLLLICLSFSYIISGCEKSEKEEIKVQCEETLTDADGNTYTIIRIGSQCWMKENLKTSKYNDNTSISTDLSNVDWTTTNQGAYAIYDNENSNKDTYGKLYNWYAVNTGKLCPSGWRIPTEEDWEDLISFLGDPFDAGGKMKTTTGWESPNQGANNSSNFSGQAGGLRNLSGLYLSMGYYGFWWSSTGKTANDALAFYLNHSTANAVLFEYSKRYGYSCRCVRE